MRLTNGELEVVLLQGGGHIADLRFAQGAGPAVNCLWEAPWRTVDPDDAELTELAAMYGSSPAGAFLAGYTGHALCLDTFGAPSPEQAALGTSLHGEAAVRPWQVESTAQGCTARVYLPAAQLEFERTLSLAPKSTVLFVSECVKNRDSREREIHWVQHLAFGLPFLSSEHCSVYASLDRAVTWPLGYEGHELLPDNANFEWPIAPCLGGGELNLERPFQRRGHGFVIAARVKPGRNIGFIAALNRELKMGVVYCFRREDFPWVAVWEENCARSEDPWKGMTQVCGMEFGTTPMPLGHETIRKMGNLFDTPGSRFVAAADSLQARYIACIAQVPASWDAITDVAPEQDSLTLSGPCGGDRISIPAEGLLDFLLKGSTTA